ncbi:MAG: FAD-dependent oxidoreductase [Deltaproteobacteria bacterium]|nr:FAD-dependent oxidoreductase [Deltaproteobacteria bacterium]
MTAQDLLPSWWDSRDAQDASYLESNFPCRAACPVGTNAGGYVSLIAQGKLEEAYALARAPNPMASICGRICAHPCESACRRGAIDDPIQIRALKRVVTEKFGVESARDFGRILAVVERPRPKAERPGKVAVVGAGPAGLSCAHDLALMGHKVVVFDGAPVAGGMMRLGIPEYRLPRELLQCEVDFIAWLGVEIRLGVEIGRDVEFGALLRDHDAVFLAPGCRKGRILPLPGGDLPGVLTAVDFLAHVNLGTPLEVGERVVVVGGGSVAFDVARSARRFGGTTFPDEEHHNLARDAALAAARLLRRDVTLVALESREEMPADPRELEEGTEEGIRVVFRRGPRAIVGEGGRVRALRTIDVARVFDDAGKFSPKFVEGTEREIPADTVVLAIGQTADLSFLGADHGLEVTRQNTIRVDRATLATSRPGVYAGGDVAFGPRIVIDAVADGRRAARAIDTRLTGRRDAAIPYRVRVFDTFGYDHPFARGDYEKTARRKLPLVPVERRERQVEVERPLGEEDARAEGSRCLHCWVNTIFDSSRMQGSECIQCGGCVDVCPEHCIDLVSLRRIARRPDGAGLRRLPDGAPLELLDHPSGAALIKDETACIRCGLCARRCPVGLITMQAFYREDEEPLVAAAERVL